MPSILTAAASRSIKPINQDACAAHDGCIVVADGIGSFYQAEVAAQLATQELVNQLSRLANITDSDAYSQAFYEVQQALRQSEIAHTIVVPASHPDTDVLGTTLLCAKADEKQITIAYVGNGAILHLRGGFTEFPANILLPWNALNYLNPHSVAQDGRNALVRFISARGSYGQSRPTVMQLQQDTTGAGDIIILCSDGIHSNDQVSVGRDTDGKLWISGEATLKRLYQTLGQYLLKEEPTTHGLEHTLTAYLASLEQDGLISDDCTVAVLITSQALQHFHRLRTASSVISTAYAAD